MQKKYGSYFCNKRPISTINPVCLLGLILNDVSLFKNIVLTQRFVFNRHNCPKRTNFLISISTSSGNIAKRPRAILVLVCMFKDCIRLMQNLCARSNVSNSADVNADQFSHPYKTLGKTTAL